MLLRSIIRIIWYFILMIFNLFGALNWLDNYTSGRCTEMWVLWLVALCATTTLIFAVKFSTSLYRLSFKKS